LQNATSAKFELTGLTLSPVRLKGDTSPFDMVVSLWQRGETVSGVVVYSEELFKRETVEVLLNRYRNLLESVVANPEERLSKLQLHGVEEESDYSLPGFLTELSPREMDKLLMEINELSGD